MGGVGGGGGWDVGGFGAVKLGCAWCVGWCFVKVMGYWHVRLRYPGWTELHES